MTPTSTENMKENLAEAGSHLKAAAGAAGEAIKGAGSAAGDELEHADADLWDVVLSGLRRRRDGARLRLLDAKMKRHMASLEEMAEMQRLAAELKRRR